MVKVIIVIIICRVATALEVRQTFRREIERVRDREID